MTALFAEADSRVKGYFAQQGRAVRVVPMVSIEHRKPELGGQPGVLLYEDLSNGLRRECFVPYPSETSLSEFGSRERWLTSLVAAFLARFPTLAQAPRRQRTRASLPGESTDFAGGARRAS